VASIAELKKSFFAEIDKVENREDCGRWDVGGIPPAEPESSVRIFSNRHRQSFSTLPLGSSSLPYLDKIGT
jgi:hypothetical protein